MADSAVDTRRHYGHIHIEARGEKRVSRILLHGILFQYHRLDLCGRHAPREGLRRTRPEKDPTVSKQLNFKHSSGIAICRMNLYDAAIRLANIPFRATLKL
jgi:hypothetical protein